MLCVGFLCLHLVVDRFLGLCDLLLEAITFGESRVAFQGDGGDGRVHLGCLGCLLLKSLLMSLAFEVDDFNVSLSHSFVL
jgi:hypothetical protein